MDGWMNLEKAYSKSFLISSSSLQDHNFPSNLEMIIRGGVGIEHKAGLKSHFHVRFLL